MSFIYQRIKDHVRPEPGSLFVEIGSERGEGSTAALAELAHQYNTKLITVDLDNTARSRIDAPVNPNIEWHLGKPGSEWCKTIWPTIAQPISMLFLDNFDWNWETDTPYPSKYQNQINEYHSRWNIEMNNENSQREHFEQFLSLESWLTPNAVIACDDTLKCEGVWTGKCGPLVTYLQCRGWQLRDTECGVIFTR